MGMLAADALLDWMATSGDRTAVQTLLPVEFVERATTSSVAEGRKRPRAAG
jgi:DNA-binding LacI/PurR family transcriptional regulator